MIVKESVIKRINEFINRDTNDCILYPVLNKEGYGQMQSYLEGKKLHYLMHRVAYQVYYKDDLTPNDVICHKCDNPACVNTCLRELIRTMFKIKLVKEDKLKVMQMADILMGGLLSRLTSSLLLMVEGWQRNRF